MDQNGADPQKNNAQLHYRLSLQLLGASWALKRNDDTKAETHVRLGANSLPPWRHQRQAHAMQHGGQHGVCVEIAADSDLVSWQGLHGHALQEIACCLVSLGQNSRGDLTPGMSAFGFGGQMRQWS